MVGGTTHKSGIFDGRTMIHDHFEPGRAWLADYPHLDASFHVVRTIRERLAGLPPDAQRKVLGANALRFYGLTA